MFPLCEKAKLMVEFNSLILLFTGVAVISMGRPPVNSLNLELLTELTTTLNDVKKQKCKGIILTSSLSSVFSAGLDIMEMYKAEKERCTQFWNALQDFWMTLYGSEIRTAAAINVKYNYLRQCYFISNNFNYLHSIIIFNQYFLINNREQVQLADV